MSKPVVMSHWHKLYENFFTSSLGFYAVVEDAVKKWELKDITLSRVIWQESGLLSDRREYLRVGAAGLTFDICAAPYGTGFFFSWWLTVTVPILGMLFYAAGLLFLGIIVFSFTIHSLGFLRGLPAGLVLFSGALFCLGVFVREGWVGSEEVVLFMPGLGAVYERIFQPPTYYRQDTIAMFQEAVGAAVQEAIQRVTTPQGIRERPDALRQPVGSGVGTH